MEKLSLQEFQELKDRTEYIYQEILPYLIEEFDASQLSEEEKEALEIKFEEYQKEIEASIKGLKERDLSDIPFEAWDGFKWLVQTMDLEGTGANIDLDKIQVIEIFDPVRLKGCNVRNFNFAQGGFDENSFDADFMREHREYFLATDIPDEDAKKRFYGRHSTLEDIIRYDLDVRDISHIHYWDRKIVEKYGIEEAKKIDLNLVKEISYQLMSWVQDGTLGTPEETLGVTGEEKDINELILSRIKYDIIQGDNLYRYDSYLKVPYIREHLPEYIIDFGVREASEREIFAEVEYTPEEKRRELLLSNYKSRYLRLSDVLQNYDIFRGKKFVHSLYENVHGLNNFNEEQIEDFYASYRDIVPLVAKLDGKFDNLLEWYLEAEEEVRPQVVKNTINQLIHSVRRDSMKRLTISDVYTVSKFFPELRELSLPNSDFLIELLITHSEEELEALADLTLRELDTNVLDEIKKLGDRFGSYEFVSKEARALVYKFGMPNLMRLDAETDGMVQALINIDGENIGRMITDSYSTRYLLEENASYEDAEKVWINIIRSYEERGNFNYGNFKGGFHERHPELYLPEDAPTSLSNKFYSRRLTFKNLRENPEWQQYFFDTSLSVGTAKRTGYVTLNDGTWKAVNYIEYLENNYPRKDVMKLLTDFAVIFDNKRIMLSDIEQKEGMPWEEVKALYYKKIEDSIRRGYAYDEHFPEDFKAANPDMFFSDNIPSDVKERIYSGKITLDDIRNVPGLYEELKTKDTSAMMINFFNQNNNLRIIQNMVGKENFLDLAYKYGYYLENCGINMQVSSASYLLGDLLDNKDEKLAEVEAKIQETILEKIKEGKLKYGPDAPDFLKEARPEIFLADDAPELLKLSFYSKYTSNHPDYLNYSANNYRLSFSGIAENPEWIEYLRGIPLAELVASKERRVYEKFDFDTVMKLIDTDVEALNLIVDANYVDTFAEFYHERSEYFAWKEMVEIEKIPNDVLAPAVLGMEPTTPEQIEAIELYEKKVEKFKLEILRNPGVFMDFPQNRLGDFNFGEYRDLKNMSAFKNSPDYRRDMEENLISHMYAFLGYSEAKKMLQLPNLSTEEIERLYDEQRTSFEAVYEKKFKIKGNVKVLNTFFEKFEPILPGGKLRFEVYKALNQKLEEGYTGDLEALLSECFEKAGIKVDKEKLKLCIENTDAVHTAEKMAFVRDEMMVRINQYIEENPADKKILFDNLFYGMKDCLAKNKMLDRAYIEEYLKTEFSRLKDDGTSFYSPHVTTHIPELLRIVDEFSITPEIASVVNVSSVDLLKTEKEKIGANWIRKARTISDNLTLEEFQALEEKLYGESGHEIEYTKHVELRDNTERGRSEAFELLKKDSNPMLLTYAKAEKMFNSFTGPYSQAFAEFFIKHKEEFMSDPKYYTILKKMNDNFDEIIAKPHNRNRFAAGKFTVAELERIVNDIKYQNVHQGEYELEYVAKLGGLNPQYFEVAQRLYAQMKERTHQTIPQMEITRGRFRGRILRLDDPLHLVVGDITDCCQAIGGHAGEGSMVHSATEKNGSVFVVEEYDEYGNYVNTVAQSWTWRNGDRICFDNVEIPDNLEDEFVQNGTHSEIFKIYREAADLILENDKKAMKSLLDTGKITKAQYDILVAKDVTMGIGCDDLVKHLPGDVKKNLKMAKIVAPLEAKKGYNAVQTDKKPWIDSSSTQYIIAEMDQAEREGLDTKGKADISEIPLQYKRTREVISRKGDGIHFDILKAMREMKKREGKESFISLQEIEDVDEIIEEKRYISERDQIYLNMNTNEDWFVLSIKTDNLIRILDTSITTGRFSAETQKTHDEALARLEYNQAMQKLILEAADSKKQFECEMDDGEKFDIFRNLAMQRIISVTEDGKVELLDRDALIRKIDSDRDTIEKKTFDRNLADIDITADSKEKKEDNEQDIDNGDER